MQPMLYGLQHSNRDWSRPDSWGKNSFNNAFPVALTRLMYDWGLQPIYLTLGSGLQVNHEFISDVGLFGDPLRKQSFDARCGFVRWLRGDVAWIYGRRLRGRGSF